MKHHPRPQAALKWAIDICGSQAKFARLIGKTRPAVSLMLSQDRALPAEHVLTVERETGVSRHDLRPDIYPRSELAK